MPVNREIVSGEPAPEKRAVSNPALLHGIAPGFQDELLVSQFAEPLIQVRVAAWLDWRLHTEKQASKTEETVFFQRGVRRLRVRRTGRESGWVIGVFIGAGGRIKKAVRVRKGGRKTISRCGQLGSAA